MSVEVVALVLAELFEEIPILVLDKSIYDDEQVTSQKHYQEVSNVAEGDEDRALVQGYGPASLASITKNALLDSFDIDSLSIPEPDIRGLEHANRQLIQKQFDPTIYDLDATFRLTKFADLKGRGYKVPQSALLKLLEGIKDGDRVDHFNDGETTFTLDTHDMLDTLPDIGIGMDCSITLLRQDDLSLVQTTDFDYPLVEDPYLQGKISCANVLSDLYAMGVTECDSMLMVLAVSTRMSQHERDVVVPLMMKGFQDCATAAGTTVTGGQTVMNPWCTIGGAATTICKRTDFIVPIYAEAKDVLVITKPLGTQVALTAHQWLEQPECWNRIKTVISENEVKKAYQRAIDSMISLNQIASELMHKYNAHGATDITGFGILGHAENLARCQKNDVSFVIHNLPVIAKMDVIDKVCGKTFQLMQGHSCETSGGLLICLPGDQGAGFCKEFEKLQGSRAWIIGVVEKGNRSARIIDKPRIIQVPARQKEGQLW